VKVSLGESSNPLVPTRSTKSSLSTSIAEWLGSLTNFGNPMSAITTKLMNEVNRYGTASVKLLLEQYDEADRPSVEHILRTHPMLLVIRLQTIDEVVCKRHRRPPANLAIAKSVACQSYCIRNRCTFLTKDEIGRYFPNIFRHGLPRGYYVRQQFDKPLLGLLKIDNHRLPVSRLIESTVGLSQAHLRRGGFRQLIQKEQFELTWLVPTDSKARSLVLCAQSNQSIQVQWRVDVESVLFDQLLPPYESFPDVAGLKRLLAQERQKTTGKRGSFFA